MKITFCIKGCATKPIGGHKVLYEFANRLANRNHEVTIVFPSQDNLYQLPFSAGVRVQICKLLTDQLNILPTWFKFDKRIKLKTVNGYDECFFPDSDYVVATAFETAKPVFNLPARCGKKIYFIQDYETWSASEDELNSTFSLGMINITISNWLCELVQKYSENDVICIPNAIDTDIFTIKKQIVDRNSHTIGILYHEGEHKGLKYSLKALCEVKKIFQDLKVIMFGAYKRPSFLPEWIEYHYRVKEKGLCDLYNNCTLFLCASVNEGFGLTGAESMACGCLLVSTDYKGVKEYAVDGYNALLSPIKDVDSLVKNICKAFNNSQLRYELAENGRKSIEGRSWDNVIQSFESVLYENNK